jgi:hypothetical protein
VRCLQCEHTFAINADTADPPFAVLLLEVFEIIERREYRRAVQQITQSYESFFLHALREQLALKLLIKSRGETPVEEANRILTLVHAATEKLAYRKLRNVFLGLAVAGPPQNIREAKETADAILKQRDDPPDEDLRAADPAIRDILLRLKNSDIDDLRNDVAHNRAYRPTHERTTKAFNDARDIIWGLSDKLDVRYDSC